MSLNILLLKITVWIITDIFRKIFSYWRLITKKIQEFAHRYKYLWLSIKFPHGSDGKESTFSAGETWVRSLGWEDPLEEGMATHSSTVAWRIPMDKGPWQVTAHGSQRLRHNWATNHTHTKKVPSELFGWPNMSLISRC